VWHSAPARAEQVGRKVRNPFRSSPSQSHHAPGRDADDDVNDAFARHRYAREDVIGKSTKDVIWPEPERRARWWPNSGRRRVKNLELKMRTRTAHR